MTTEPRWFGRDKRGARLGLVVRPLDTEHPGCLDLVADIATGYVVLARLDKDTRAALLRELAPQT